MCIICVYVFLSACLRFDFVYVCLLSSGFGSLVPVVVFIGFEIGGVGGVLFVCFDALCGTRTYILST